MPRVTFDHEKLRAYQQALRFVSWSGPLLERLPAKLAARDQLERASTSIVLNIAEGNGRRSRLERCRYLDAARGSTVECAACLDVVVMRKHLTAEESLEGKQLLVGAVSLISGLLAHFSKDGTGEVCEDPAEYAEFCIENENENENENDRTGENEKDLT